MWEEEGPESVREVWGKFFRAGLILGAHGMALSHIIAARPGAALLELMQPLAKPKADGGTGLSPAQAALAYRVAEEDPGSANTDFQIMATSLEMPYYAAMPSFYEGRRGESYMKVASWKVLNATAMIQREQQGEGWQEGANVMRFEGPQT